MRNGTWIDKELSDRVWKMYQKGVPYQAIQDRTGFGSDLTALYHHLSYRKKRGGVYHGPGRNGGKWAKRAKRIAA